MIVLQDKSLPTVWEDYEGLKTLEPDQQANRKWGNRKQHFQWVNDIEYVFDKKMMEKIHVVVCKERWLEIDKDNNPVEKRSRHAWVSSEPLTAENLHERCNLGARHRWGIEESILVEKRLGYQYEHLFSWNWSAMKGFHYLMRLGHALTELAIHAEQLFNIVASKGIAAFIKYIRDSLTHNWLDPEQLYERLQPKPQLRLA